MKKRFQTNQRILLSGLAFRFAIAFLLCSLAIAQPPLIEPYPTNPSGNTIIVTDIVEAHSYTNNGTIDNQSGINFYGDSYNIGTINNWDISYLFNSGHFYNEGDIDNAGTIDNEGRLYNTGTIENSGTIYSGWFAKLHNYNSGTINNNGIIENSGDELLNNGTINNWGIIDNHDELLNGGTINNWGEISIGHSFNTGTINNQNTIFGSHGFYNKNGGTLMGTGTFIGNLYNMYNGIVAPGNSVGTMTVDGDYILGEEWDEDAFPFLPGPGILDIEIGGFTEGTFDVLDITGTAYMPGGNINFSFLDGYDIVTDFGPYESKELTFLQTGVGIDSFASTIIYDFLSIPYFQFDVFQRGNNLVFEATNLVPLPGAVLLGGIGLAVASWKLRRRKEL